MLITIPVSAGELIDKITILEIKSFFIKDKNKLKNIKSEHKLLKSRLNYVLKKQKSKSNKVQKFQQQIYQVNRKLWKIEEDIRKLESRKEFGDNFIKLSRSIYNNNDKRYKIKNKINTLLKSEIIEEKDYGK